MKSMRCGGWAGEEIGHQLMGIAAYSPQEAVVPASRRVRGASGAARESKPDEAIPTNTGGGM
eukprot:13134769-Alexandrium_andersonii.AAC.1